MVPEKTDARWKKLLTGEINHQFKTVSASLCLSRNKRLVQRDPGPETMQKCIDDIHGFFIQFEKILTDDCKAIFG